MTRDGAIAEVVRILQKAEQHPDAEQRASLVGVAEGWRCLADTLGEPLEAVVEPAPQITVHVSPETRDIVPAVLKALHEERFAHRRSG